VDKHIFTTFHSIILQFDEYRAKRSGYNSIKLSTIQRGQYDNDSDDDFNDD